MYDYADVDRLTTPAVLAAVAAAHPDRQFVVADDGTVTYGEASARVAALALALRAAGVEPGDRIGIELPNGVRWCIGMLAAHAAGACAVPLNTWFKPPEREAVLRRARPRIVLAAAEFPQPADVADPLDVLRAAPCDPTDDALLLFTSGSSAEPKAVRLSQHGMVATAHAVGERQGIRDDDRFWFALPLFFVFGCSNALPNALTHGATLCLQGRFEPASALEFLERERCTVYYGVAPITRALAAHPDLARRDISALRTGTANSTPEDLRIAIEDLGISEVCNAYGLTEGHGHSTITSHTDPPEVRMTSQGTVLPTQELRIVDGQIQIRGLITPGYLDAPAAGADGWFSTGDLGHLDEHGRLHYTGRSHEMIKAKGINVSPAEVEALLVAHPAVNEAFVFGVDTADGDEEVGCVLVTTLTSAERDSLATELPTWARERVSSYKVPRRVWFRTAAELPLTATGKVSKRLLRDHVLAPQTEPPSAVSPGD